MSKKRMVKYYRNGNYNVLIFSDGTKIRSSSSFEDFKPKFPESIDCKISNRCNIGCPMCHEQSVPDGKLANLDHPLFSSLHQFTELALGGGNVLEHPDLERFLQKMKEQEVICNVTLHVKHFMDHFDYIRDLCARSLIQGIGVSINDVVNEDILNRLKKFPDLIVHTIAGVMPQKGYEILYDEGLKLLILGYKSYGRGLDYISNKETKVDDKIYKLNEMIPKMVNHFHIISFDNLAIEQLGVRDLIPSSVWQKGYMGDDGQFTMYLDMVEEEYAKSSISPRSKIDSNKIEDLFQSI